MEKEVRSMAEFEKQRHALDQERKQIQEQIDMMRKNSLQTAMNAAVGELSVYDQHPADLASELFEREKDAALLAGDQQRLEQIDAALERMAHGTYGFCRSCGHPIEAGRLEAEPAADLCASCRRTLDTRHDVSRSVKEQVSAGTFSRSNRDGRDEAAFDGEDAWQSVERMNNRPHRAGLDDVTEDDDETYVEPIEAISNEEYRAQLPD